MAHLNPVLTLTKCSEYLSPISSFSPVHFLKRKFSTISCKKDFFPTLQKVWNVAVLVFKGALSLFFYWTNPSLFAIGFITGIVLDDKVRFAIRKIKDVWKTQPWGMTIIGGVASFFSLPVSIAAGSIFWAANIGSKMSHEAQRILNPKEDPRPNEPKNEPAAGEIPEKLSANGCC